MPDSESMAVGGSRLPGRAMTGSSAGRSSDPSYSLLDFLGMVRRRRWLLLAIVCGLLALCLAYCLMAPNQYEASAKVALRIQPATSLVLDSAESIAPASILSTPLQLETLANVFRSERLAWRVIGEQRLYDSQGFVRRFGERFPNFQIDKPSPEAQGYLLESFAKRLHVRALPRTLLIEVRFRSRDAALSAAVVNALIRNYSEGESEMRLETTRQASEWLRGQLTSLTAETESAERRLGEFERQHSLLSSEEVLPGGQPVETLRDPTVDQVEDVGRQLAAATGDRILREAVYREAQLGDPERVVKANPGIAPTTSAEGSGVGLLDQIETKRSEAGSELAQLSAEHGPNFPRVVELGRIVQDLDAQKKAEEGNLLESLRRAASAAADRERTLRRQLDALTAEGLRRNDATIEYAVLRERASSGRELCSRLERRIAEASLSAGVHASSILVVDSARVPFKPVAPDPPLYMGITLVAGLWLALGAGWLLDALGVEGGWPGGFRPGPRAGLPNGPPDGQRDGQPGASPGGKLSGALVGLAVLGTMLAGAAASGQAPTPSTSGLPTGVVKLPQDGPVSQRPDSRAAPQVWNPLSTAGNQTGAGLPALEDAPRAAGLGMALPIAAGDFVEVTESHTPEFRTAVRVAADGTAQLPMVGAVKVAGLSESAAAHAIEKALFNGGLLLHPQVAVLVTAAVGQDVSMLGEVARPGVYAYTVHHRLLDLISAASGLTTNAGRLVNVFHRDDPHTGHPVVLEPGAADAKPGDRKTGDEHNPELAPGDTVVVSRAGLAYVIGDVVRPGGFAVDPVQGLTVVQALSLAWGSTPNAAVGKAILIRNQTGGRTLTTLNLKRMIRGQDPDLPVKDRDILFVPDSTTRSLMNKSLEAAIQSAIGVTIYAGLVYSQRF
jgi:polysaccharide export outer membrane protein